VAVGVGVEVGVEVEVAVGVYVAVEVAVSVTVGVKEIWYARYRTIPQDVRRNKKATKANPIVIRMMIELIR
jgi:hypothetical protein